MRRAAIAARPAGGRPLSCGPRVWLAPAAAAGLLAITCLGASPVTAQQTRITGRVVDTAGVAVSGLGVVLHRVDGSGGARIAEGVSDETGGFALSSAEQPVADAVYFVAARVDDKLYIGPFVRPPIDTAEDYTVVVGGEPVDFGGVALPAHDGVETVAPPPSRRWALALVPALMLVTVTIVLVARSRGPSERRRLLIRIARLDNEPASQPGDMVNEERSRLVERLLSLER